MAQFINIKLKHDSHNAIAYLGIAALLGLFLRLIPAGDIQVNYRFIVHGHSHIALLGWVYLAITTLIVDRLQPESVTRYRPIVRLTHITLVGMLLTFPFQGYAILSIIFSTAFLLVSYLFTIWVWKRLRHTPDLTRRLLRSALIWMVLSSIGPWALGAIISTVGKESELYRLAIYFYLHFQYNGWFFLALLGMLTSMIEDSQATVKKTEQKRIVWVLNAGVLFSYGLSTLWIEPVSGVYLIGAIGIGLILTGLIDWAYRFRASLCKWIRSLHPRLRFLYKFAIICWLLKFAMQLLSALPFISRLVSQQTDIVIAYLHLVFLGAVSISLFFVLMNRHMIRIAKAPLILYLAGFLLSEILIFYRAAIALWAWFPYVDTRLTLVIVSSALPISIIWIWLINQRSRNWQNPIDSLQTDENHV